MDAYLFEDLPPGRREAPVGWLHRAMELADVLVERKLCDRCGGDGQDPYLHVCRVCRGAGQVKVPPPEWVAAGRRYRAERKARGERDYDVARRMGCQPADVRAMERGELPVPAILF